MKTPHMLTPHDRAVLIAYSFRSFLGDKERDRLITDIQSAIKESLEDMLSIGDHHALLSNTAIEDILQTGWCSICRQRKFFTGKDKS